MAMIKCRECGASISDKAASCPACGAPSASQQAMRQAKGVASTIWNVVKILVALVVLAVVYQCTSTLSSVAEHRAAAPVVSSPLSPAVETGACTTADIEVKSLKARFVDACSARSPCPGMKGIGVLVNRCSTPVGVQLKVTALDKRGAPVASKDLWPNSISNIPPGDYTFSMDTWLDYDPAIASFELQPIQVKRWK